MASLFNHISQNIKVNYKAQLNSLEIRKSMSAVRLAQTVCDREDLSPDRTQKINHSGCWLVTSHKSNVISQVNF